jgi:TetR/AcrR family transcriptional regulator, tetracycline repressor protein
MARKKRRSPGERAGLARDAVLAIARRISEDEGVGALTMRRLADELGVAPNALYSHYPDKQALLDDLLDSLMADVPLPDPSIVDWRTGLFDLMSASRQLLLAHTELIPQFLARPGRGPSALRLGEVTLALLARAPLGGRAAVDAMRILLIYVFGFAGHEAPRRTDTAPEERLTLNERAFRSDPARPRMRELAPELAQHPDDQTFAKGLRWLIDGIARSAAGLSV